MRVRGSLAAAAAACDGKMDQLSSHTADQADLQMVSASLVRDRELQRGRALHRCASVDERAPRFCVVRVATNSCGARGVRDAA